MRALLFPGQGSQYVGMAADLFRSDPAFRALVQLASEHVGEDLEPVCLRGPDKRLRRPGLLQPVLVAVSLGYWRHMNECGLRAHVVLGHSLGEITALAVSGVLTPEDAVRVAAKRGAFMEQAAATVCGGMLAVTTNRREKALALVERLATSLPVSLANDNAPGQFVLAGEREALAQVGRQLSAERLGRCQPLPVDGPWHSSFMGTARDAFRVWVEPLVFQPPGPILILNGTGTAETDPSRIKQQVIETLAGPVRWRACMTSLAALHPREIVEVGPGRVLAGLVRANGIDNATETICVGDLRGVQQAASSRGSSHTDGGGK